VPDKLQFGLIGCGSQGQYLCEALAMTGLADLVACCDVKAQAAEGAAARLGFEEAYDDCEQMLLQASLDAVIIATTHDQLQPMALAAVSAGKHALVEKPMALNAADGRELVGAAKDAGVHLMVGYTLRFMPERILMKQLLDEGAVGDIAHVIAGQLIGGLGGWLADPAHGGGPLLYVGTHVLDQVLWVVGSEAEQVFAEVTWAESGVEAGVSLTIRFEDDVVAQVCTSQKMGGRYGWLDVIGSAGRVRTEWESNELYVESRAMETYRHPTRIEVPMDPYLPPVERGARGSMVAVKYLRMWATELAEFCNSILEERLPAVTGEDAVAETLLPLRASSFVPPLGRECGGQVPLPATLLCRADPGPKA